MLQIYERLGVSEDTPVDIHLVLDHEQRDKSRLRILSAEGDVVNLVLERGKPLQVGELLRSECGRLARIEGAVEPVITAYCDDWQVFARACYHLGNRHVRLQVGNCWLRIVRDHVLGRMLERLGLFVREEDAVFIPESGAYYHDKHHH